MLMSRNNQKSWSLFCNFKHNFHYTVPHAFFVFGSISSTGCIPLCKQLMVVSRTYHLSCSNINTTFCCREKITTPITALLIVFNSFTFTYTIDMMRYRGVNLLGKHKNFSTKASPSRGTFTLIKKKPLIIQQRRDFLRYIKALKFLKRQTLEECKKKLLPRQRRRYNSLPFNLKTSIPVFLRVPRDLNFVKNRNVHSNPHIVEHFRTDLPANENPPVVSKILDPVETIPKVPLLIIPGSSLYASRITNENPTTVEKNLISTQFDLKSNNSNSLPESKIRKRRFSKKKIIDDSSVDYEEKSFDSYRGTTFLTLRPTRNNFFLTLWESRKGRMLINVSSGCVGFSGPDRVSEYAIKLLTLHFLRLVRIKKIRHFRVIVPDGAKSSSNVKRCLGILGESSSGVHVSFVLHISSRAHNGCRGRKQRRV